MSKLRSSDILSILYDSEIDNSSGDEIDDFPHEELDNLLVEFASSDIEEAIEEDDDSIIIQTNKKDIKWVSLPFNPPILKLDSLDDTVPSLIKTPMQYFLEYFDKNYFEQISYFTNLYAIQKSQTRFKPTSADEIKIVIGIHIIMGSLKLPRVRMYWEKDTRVPLVADNMTRDRFFSIRSNIHFIDNMTIPPGNKDVFIKIRPLYDTIQKKCNSLPMERNICIDEQMVPFKGHLSIKQYIRNKPNPWGIKIFVLCGEGGIVYDFVLYQGANTEIDSQVQKQFGQGPGVVLHLCKIVKKNKHFLYFDNYFSSFNLFERLQQIGICAAGTIRVNRFAKPPILSDKNLAKIGRGTTFEVRSDVPSCNIGLVQWCLRRR